MKRLAPLLFFCLLMPSVSFAKQTPPWLPHWVGELSSFENVMGTGTAGIKYTRFINLEEINRQLSADGYKTLPTNKMILIGGSGAGLYEDGFMMGGGMYFGAITSSGTLFSDQPNSKDGKLYLAYGNTYIGKLLPLWINLDWLARLNLGAGALALAEGSDQDITRLLLTVEPEFGVVYKLSRFFMLSLTASYLKSVALGHWVKGTFPESFPDKLNLNNYTVNLNFTWGTF